MSKTPVSKLVTMRNTLADARARIQNGQTYTIVLKTTEEADLFLGAINLEIQNRARAIPDPLTAIHGIGLGSQRALRAEGIDSFLKISESSAENLQTALDAQGIRPPANFKEWPLLALECLNNPPDESRETE